jgi:hypothetical protein
MADQELDVRTPRSGQGETRRPFVQPAVEELGTLTIVTQQTIIIPP